MCVPKLKVHARFTPSEKEPSSLISKVSPPLLITATSWRREIDEGEKQYEERESLTCLPQGLMSLLICKLLQEPPFSDYYSWPGCDMGWTVSSSLCCSGGGQGNTGEGVSGFGNLSLGLSAMGSVLEIYKA